MRILFLRSESTTTRKTGALNFRPQTQKAKAFRVFNVELASECKAPGVFGKIQEYL